MEEKVRSPKEEHDAKIRCAQFLLDMLQKYGAEIAEEKKSEGVIDNA